MNFQQLEYAIAVHQHKHFGLAAEHCNITQATLSAMIKKLEEELDYVLFDRSRKPVKTTDLGLQFVERARQILAQKEELSNLSNESGTLQGTLRIGIIPTIAVSLLPIILSDLSKDNPDLKIKILEITTEEIKQQLRTDKIDLGILATPLEDLELEEHILYYEQMLVYGKFDSEKKFVTSKDIKGGNIWLFEEGHCFREQATTICEIKEKELIDSNLEFRGNSFETLVNMARRYGGYTLLPELYARELPANMRKNTRPFQKPVPVREISIVNYRKHANRRAIAYLEELIKTKIGKSLSTNDIANKDQEIIGIT